ncbi:MAG: hypothetical protein J5722_08510, partial [Oscillospiraceae bacterium]|nr:hypothetical protein [Oscillospiraceae bacterium]
RIAAALIAASAAFCSLQSVGASAYTYNHRNWLTQQTQDSTEYPMNFAHSLYYLQRSYSQSNIYTYTDTLYSGLVLGPGYSTTTISGLSQGTLLSGSLAWARYLGNSFYGSDTVYTEQYPSNLALQQGDQIIMTWNNTKYALFVTSIDGNHVYCSELWGSTIRWGEEFIRTGNTMKRRFGGTEFTMNCVVRPVKEGDANGDSVVDYYDFAWIADHRNQYSFPGKHYETLMMAADLNGNWSLDDTDATTVLYNYNYGRMEGDYRYVTTWHSV